MTDGNITTTVSGGHIQGVAGAGHVVIENFTIYNQPSEKQESSASNSEPLPRCPYPGLSYFGPADAELFFGRENAIGRLVDALNRQSLTALVGASGAGKSSVVLAGVAPRLFQTSKWRFTHFRIGNESTKNPFLALARALVPLYVASESETERLINTKKLAASLQNRDLDLLDVFADCRSRNKGTRILLIADQFEELFTTVENDTLIAPFINLLIDGFPKTKNDSAPDLCLVLTLRGDFYGRALKYRPFADALQGHVENLGTMNRAELNEAILRPAEKANVSFEAGLVDTVLDNVESKPGSLPLLQFALREMWNFQAGRTIKRTSYVTVGGIQGSLARRAEAIYAALTENGSRLDVDTMFRRLFTRLVMLVDGQEDTRRVVDRDELGDELWSLAQRLADEDNRLLVTNALASRETVELAHEALIQHWPTLLRWLERDRAFQMWLRQIRISVALWANNKSDGSPLLRGTLLADAVQWIDTRREELSVSEQEFITASQVADERLRSQSAFLKAVLQSLGVIDFQDHDAITEARMKKLREFVSRVPDTLPGYRDIVGMFAESIGLEPLSALSELGPQASGTTLESISDVGRSPSEYARSFIVIASTGAKEEAFADSSGSFFGRFFAEAISGKAANEEGLVTVRGVYEYIQERMAHEIVLKQVSQRPLMRLEGRATGAFPITATSLEMLPRSGKRKAILAASDQYEDSRVPHLVATESLMQACVPDLVDLGGFEVSLLTGREMTRERLTHELMRALHDSGPEDVVLFYFSGHSGYSGGVSGSLELFLVDSEPGQPLSSLSLEDLGQTMRRSKLGTAIMILDTSFAGGAIDSFTFPRRRGNFEFQ